MDNKEYVVTFRTAQQISPDDWDTVNPAMKVHPYTTIAEIEAFYRQYVKIGKTEIKLIELSKPTP